MAATSPNGVAPEQRFIAKHPCPVCGGHVGLPAGRSVRCAGYVSSDGRYFHCTREEYAGGIEPKDAAVPTYAHRADGPCKCGKTHGTAPPVLRSIEGGSTRRQVSPPTRYPIRDRAGVLRATHVRRDYDDGTKSAAWLGPDGLGGLGGVPLVDLPLYGIHEVYGTSARSVFVTEGEKARDALSALGVAAVGTVTGAGPIPGDDALRDLLGFDRVVLWPDNDGDGESHMARIAARLVALGMPPDRVLRARWDDAPAKGDAFDFVAGMRADGAGDDEVADAVVGVLYDSEPWPADADAAPDGSDYSGYSDAEPVADPETPNTPNVRMAPAFPVSALPPWMQAYAGAAAAAVPVPVEMVAVPMIALTGALIGNRLRLELKPGYSERPSIFAAVVAPPGSAKTAALGYGRRPFNALQRAEAKRYADAKRAYDAAVAEWKRAPEDGRGEPPAKPALRHYQTSDTTKEALAAMLADGASPGVAVIRDEVVALIKGFNAYRGGKGGDQEFYMEAWSSFSAPVDRRHAETQFVESPVIAVVGGIQPDLARELHDAANRRNGLVERFLPVVPDVKAARWTEDSVPADLDADACAAVRTLDETLVRLAARVVGDDPGVAVVFAPEAKALWREWYDDNAESAERAGGLAGGFYRKLAAYVARFALVLHALWNPNKPERPVSAARMADAIELGEFFRAHIDRFLPLIGVAGGGASAGVKPRVLRAIERAKPEERHGEWVPRSAILDRLRTVKAADLTTALDALRDEGRVECRVVETATKSAERWRLVPFGHSENSVFPGGDGEYSEFSERPNGRYGSGTDTGDRTGTSADSVPWEPARLDGFAAPGECRVCAAVTDGGDLCRDCRAESWTA